MEASWCLRLIALVVVAGWAPAARAQYDDPPTCWTVDCDVLTGSYAGCLGQYEVCSDGYQSDCRPVDSWKSCDPQCGGVGYTAYCDVSRGRGVGPCQPATPRPEVCNGCDDDRNGIIDDSSSQDVCNGVDDDCDGQVDEDEPTISCGAGACRRSAACVGGSPGNCTPGQPSAEVCNGVDDDCDGQTDEGLGTLTCGSGAAIATLPACVNGVRMTCVPRTPGTEVCNGADDDLDGQVDEGLGTKVCGQGACRTTVAACTAGRETTCPSAGSGTAETCNGVDDDCDGSIDEAGVCRSDGQVCCQPTPQSVACSGKNCGTVSDGCGGTLSCGGTCTSPSTCGGGGTPNVCGFPCTPETPMEFCDNHGAMCGMLTAPDQCGNLRMEQCGLCDSGYQCGTEFEPNVCVPSECPLGCRCTITGEIITCYQ